mgnify:CR=1 FL=1
MKQKVKISKVKGNPSNPRIIKNDKFKKLVTSIKEFPEMLKLRPIVVDEDMIVLGGNMRLKASKEAGLKEVWIDIAEGLTEEQKKEFIVKDNVGFGEWEWDMLANEWDSVQLAEWGLDVWENLDDKEPEAGLIEDDEIPEVKESKVKRGDIWQLGEHRVMCGDSTSSDDVAKLMNGEKADLAHNDPPYGMKKENDGVLNDNLNYSDLLNFNKEWIPLQFTYLKDNGSFYCWGIDEPLMDIYSEILKPYIKEQKATFRNLITWDKGNGQGQNSDNTRSYAIADEKCLFAMCGVQGFNNNADNYFDKWEPIRIYLEKEIKKFNESDKKIATALGYKDGRTVNHWWSKSQWTFPTEKNYNDLRKYLKTKNTEGFKKEYEGFKKEYEELKKDFYGTRAYFNNTHDNFNNVWHFDRHIRKGNEGGHATPKPIPLCERAIKSSCPDNGLVIDMFLGSGSTLIAAEKLNRKCYGMELDEKYCDVIIERWEQFTGQKAIKNGTK